MKLRRWASNWVRLVLLLLGPNVLSLADRSVFRQIQGSRVPEQNAQFGALDFDMTLGYPGEGPEMRSASGFRLPMDFSLFCLRGVSSFLVLLSSHLSF